MTRGTGGCTHHCNQQPSGIAYNPSKFPHVGPLGPDPSLIRFRINTGHTPSVSWTDRLDSGLWCIALLGQRVKGGRFGGSMVGSDRLNVPAIDNSSH